MQAEFPLCFRRGKAVLPPSPSSKHPLTRPPPAPRDAAAGDAALGGTTLPASHLAGQLQVKSEVGLGTSPGGIASAVS